MVIIRCLDIILIYAVCRSSFSKPGEIQESAFQNSETIESLN